MSSDEQPGGSRSGLGHIGPAIITASVVIGPGSILTASKIGQSYGYQMIWIPVLAALLMFGMTTLSARLGVLLDGTLCDELAQRAGRPVAVVAGLSLFLITACFQFGNNTGVLAAIEPFYESGKMLPILVIVALNAVIIVALFGFRSLYQPVERLMKVLVGLMIVGFAGNLLMARPDILEILSGLVPHWQVTMVEVEANRSETLGSQLPLLTPLFATTFSVAAAFYQSYLVRQKGWTDKHLRQGLIDTGVGVGVLGLITLLILITAASQLHGKGVVLNSAADVAVQLEPAFGPVAKVLFCLGIFAGAFSSFLVNAMIGGAMLADGLGCGGYLDQKWPKRFTVLVLLIGMIVAIAMTLTGQKPVNLIIFAQAITVLGFPVLAGVMVWLSTRSDIREKRRISPGIRLLAWVGLALTLVLAVKQASGLYARFG